MTDELRLRLILILCSIAINKNYAGLRDLVQVCSYFVTDNDFNKIMRKSLKILESQKCGTESCTDWLMNSLFELYKNDSKD
jgi:hypothetical protein